MTTTIEADMQRQLDEARAAEDRARAQRKAAAEELRWIERNRLQIASDTLDLLRQVGDEDMVEQIDQAWSEAMQALRDKRREQTASARAAVADGARDEQGPASRDNGAPVADGAGSEQGSGVYEQSGSVVPGADGRQA